MPPSRQPPTTELALLGLLRAGPRHAYQLYQELSRPEGLWAVWRMKQSQLYALLARLEQAGLVSATLQPQAARPPRRVYRLTRAGQAALRKWVRAPVEHPREMRLDFLLKLYFARREGPEAAARLLAAQRTDLQARLDALAAELRPAAGSHAWLVSQFREKQLRFLLDWLAICAQTVIASPSA